MASHTVWGVDIGNSAVKAIKMIRRDRDEARIVDFDIIDIQGGDDDADRATRVHAALGTLCGNHDFGKDPVYLSLPGNLCLFREFQLPPGSESKLTELVQYEAKQQIPFPLDQVEMAWERYEDPSGAGVGVQMIVVRKNIIEEHLALTDQFNLNVQGISVAPVALYNFIQYEFQPKGATLILDAGHKSTDFVVVRDRHMYSRTIQIAGREITRVLENKFKVPFEKAEDLKKNLGQSKQADKIMSVIEPTLRQLTGEIQRTIGFYKSKARGQKLAAAYLLGHTFRLPNMAEVLAGQIREADFTIVEGVTRTQLDRAINPDVFANEFPTMAVTIGLGLQGLGLSEWKANLLPEQRKVEGVIQQKRIWGVLSAAAVVLALLASYFTAKMDRTEAEKAESEVKDAIKDLKSVESRLKKAVHGLGHKNKQLARLSRIARDRGRVTDIYHKVLTLKDAQGQPYFGAKSKVYLTNVYASRVPFNLKEGAKLEPTLFDNNRQKRVTDSVNMNKGAESLYKSLEKVGGLQTTPPELRPDIPLIVIVSGECEGDEQRVFGVLTELEKALRLIPGVQDVKTNERVGTKPVFEVVPQYGIDGKVVPTKPTHGEKLAKAFTAFHMMFRWNPPDDKDIEPKPVVAKAKKSKKKS